MKREGVARMPEGKANAVASLQALGTRSLRDGV